MKGALPIIFSLLFIGSTFTVLAQDDHDEHDPHHETKNEIGGAIGMVFDLNEQSTASSFHLHYTRMFGGKLERFGVSSGVGFLFGEHRHYTLHVMLMYRPTHGWWLAAGPGITYFENQNEWAASGHIETGYEFDAGKVHFGPVVEYSWASEDQHIMVGLHLGVPF